MVAAWVAVQYHELEQSFYLYFCHAPPLYIFVCASLHMLCSCFYFFASCVRRHTQPHARTKCRFHSIWMLLLWRVLTVACGCCFLRGHEGKEGGSECPPRVTLNAGVMRAADVSCAPSDGGPSYRVRVWRNCSAASAEAQHENYTFSGFDVRMHGRNGELCAVCHVANAVHTCSNCAASCARKEEGATVAFTMNVTTHKYAGPYELWWRQFPRWNHPFACTERRC
ncbi:hypothetical protein Tc00.1047053510359.450 [Trypanosoma cruzi]|uniref:Uncharacterized protein n=1 Tax=Trypanosoma cruzi (strain CL Brener) TaxID=353153 RepID=Q4E536_TRYCC|nr:hypothetical protein Tc00.1047053510359.450 [Trypanosoma cruzi]EAN99900.1 hypothetical protein Tc00.1047053510359.450 [Trypanosoma cruzi]|eukprot:XP_821751.1 hypothetical protein [Trypanosoma cruzi strain CL Brener]